MELHTLRAVKITKNIFELRRVNTELQKFRQHFGKQKIRIRKQYDIILNLLSK